MQQGYLSHHAAMAVVRDPRAAQILPPTGKNVPEGIVHGSGGEIRIVYDFRHFLADATRLTREEEYDRVWLTGALMTLGDALRQHAYFDRAPELELIRHLRNAVGHGNRFRIDSPASLAKFPAHTRDAEPQPGNNRGGYIEITPSLHGKPCLFDYIEAWELVTLFQAVGGYLRRLADGPPGHGDSTKHSRTSRGN